MGYDVVAYHTSNTAIRGSAKHSVKHDGVTWYFSTEEHKQAFQKDPQKYMPKYGGWCAYAVSAKNEKFETDPQTFKLYNGELYLFYNGKLGNTSVPWNQDEASMQVRAEKNWSVMRHKN